MPDPAHFSYRAFISYSHRDKAWADWLHKALETYRVPSRLVGTTTAHGTIPRRLNPVFRDRDELSSSPELGTKINQALSQSENLIVICSPASAASRWVNEEVLAYKRMGRAGRIFCLIADGEPNAADLPSREAEECFCPALRFATDADGRPTAERTEPIAADARPGKDGKSNAKLKLIAGMLDVGFDALKQREQQRRIRRVTWLAAFALVGMFVLAVLAGMAVRERNEAQLQREQAEKLVGFMLGNLRTKLDTVGRLDILNDVANHAMAYFEAQHNAGDVALRSERAKAFLLLGRIRLDEGSTAAAQHAFSESLDLGTTLLEQGNITTNVALNVIDAQFWLGKTAWQIGKIDGALMHFQAALPVINALVTREPNDTEALERRVWAHLNLGHIFQAKGASQEAMREYAAELQGSQQLVERQPHNRGYQREVANAYDDVAALLYARSDLTGAERHYRAERDLLQKLVSADPRDKDTTSALAIAQTFLAQTDEALGHSESARTDLQQAMAIGSAAVSADPANMDEAADLASYCRRLARNLRLARDFEAASPLLDRASSLYSEMLQKDPASVRAQFGQAATQLEMAWLAWETSAATSARNHADGALRGFSHLLHAQNYQHDAGLGAASTDVLLGEIDAADGATAEASRKWTDSLDALTVFANDANDPDELSIHAETLALLGRLDEARPLIARLDAIRYRDPAFVAWRERYDISGSHEVRTAFKNRGKLN